MIIVPYRPDHLAALRLQPLQAFMGAFIDCPGYPEHLAQAGPAYTGLVGGAVVICAGVSLELPTRGTAWALLSEQACRHLIGCTRAVETFLRDAQIRRVQTYVDTAFAAGHRWARLLGFEREGTLRAWGPAGEDYDLYARVTP